jgi:signal transduction histidine kinase/DNA-binding response OmpR family regulator
MMRRASAALLPSVDDPEKKGDFAASRAKQRAREAASACAVVSIQMSGLLVCNTLGIFFTEYTTQLARAVGFFEPLVLVVFLVGLHSGGGGPSPGRWWLHLCVLIHSWLLLNGVAMVAIMVYGGCADNTPQRVGFLALPERLCRYGREGMYPSWMSIFVVVSNMHVVILDQLSFRTNSFILLTEYMLYTIAFCGIIGTSALPTSNAYSIAAHVWNDFVTAMLLIWTFEREQRYDFLEIMAEEQVVNEEKMLAALLCHEIKNPLTVMDFFLGRLKEQQQQQQQQQQRRQQQQQQQQLKAAAGEAGEVGEGGGSGATAPNNGLHEALQAALAVCEPGADSAMLLGRQRALIQLLPDAIQCTNVMVDLVENCRHLAKVESGTYTPREEELDLQQLAESCLGLFGREREAGLVLDLHCPAGLTIVSDRLLWRQVLVNLVGNAVKFTMLNQPLEHVSPPRVVVRIDRDDVNPEMLRVEVSDNGPGIDLVDQAFIFGKFSQAGTHGFRAPQGLSSGIGLHLSVTIVQMLHGKLDLLSPVGADGRGTRFGFVVPCTFVQKKEQSDSVLLRDHAPAPFNTSFMDSAACRELRFLLVEDDDMNCLIMRKSIEAGFHKLSGGTVTTAITHARNGEEAMRLVGNGPTCAFDVVICDQHMETSGGVMKGTEFVQALRALMFPHTPVVVLASGNTEEADVTAYRACGADTVWSKPYPSALQLTSDVVALLQERSISAPLLPPATHPAAAETTTSGKGPSSARDAELPPRQSQGNWLNRFCDALVQILPDVPCKDYIASRRKTAAKRDVWLVRALAIVDTTVRVITNENGPVTIPVCYSAMPFIFLVVMWNPKRWQFGAVMGTMILTADYVYDLIDVASGRCNDPADMGTSCLSFRTHLIDIGHVSMFWVTNVFISFCGGLDFSTHMRAVAVQIVLVVARSIQNGANASNITDTAWMAMVYFGFAFCVERKRRFRYLEGVLNEQLAAQQKTLVTLLWYVSAAAPCAILCAPARLRLRSVPTLTTHNVPCPPPPRSPAPPKPRDQEPVECNCLLSERIRGVHGPRFLLRETEQCGSGRSQQAEFRVPLPRGDQLHAVACRDREQLPPSR